MKQFIAFVLGLCLVVSASRAQTQQPSAYQQAAPTQPQDNSGWQQVNIGATQALVSICFIDPDTGWIAGGDGLFMTTDSGNTWLPWGPAGIYLKVQFLNSTVGWAMTDLGAIIHTTDGGQHWINQATGYAPNDFFFLNADTGIACRAGESSRTTDGGTHWTNSQNDAYNGLYKILSFDPSHLLMVGKPTYWQNQLKQPQVTAFLFSSDAGLTWTRVKFDSAHNALYTGVILSSTEAFLAGDEMTAHTTDGGQSWSFRYYQPDLFKGSSFPSGNAWFLGGADGSAASAIFISTNGGINWTAQSCPDVGVITDIAFPTPLKGWAVTGSAGVLRTSTGGFASVAPVQQAKLNLAVQVFPNPSQGQVQFEYSLPRSESMTLRVYGSTPNLVGRDLSFRQ